VTLGAIKIVSKGKAGSNSRKAAEFGVRPFPDHSARA